MIRTPVSVVVATCCLTGAALAIGANARSVVDLSRVGTWFANDNADSVSHIGPAGTDATVTLARPVGALTVTQLDGVAYVTDASGLVSRVDPAQLSVSQQGQLPSASSQLVAGGGKLYVVDRSAGAVAELDPHELTARTEMLAIGRDLGRAVVGGDGVLWVPDRATGEVVSVVDGRVRDNVRVADPGDDLLLSVVGARVLVVNATTSTVTEVGASRSTSHTLALSGSVDLPANVAAGGVLPVLSGAGLTTFDVVSGRSQSIRLPVAQQHLGTPVSAGDRVYIPDFSAGALIVVDVRTGVVVDTIEITGVSGRFELIVTDGHVFVNDPGSERAWTLGSTGVLVPVAKYDPSRPGDGTGPAPSVPPAPRPGAGNQDDRDEPRDPPRPTTPGAPTTTTTVAPAPTTTVPGPTVVVVPTPGNGNGNGGPPNLGNGAVLDVSASPGDGEATVTWQPPQNWRTVTGYRLKLEPGGLTRNVAAGTTSLTIGNLTNGVTYRFTITARSTAALGQPVTSDGVTPTAMSPDAPRNVTATPGDGQATVAWTSPAGGPAFDSYAVELVPASGGTPISVVVPAAQPTVTITGLTNGADYHAVVRATAGPVAGAPAASATFTPRGRPSMPVVTAWVSGPGAITVSWSASAANGSPIARYTISAAALATREVTGDVTTTTFTGLAADSVHTFTVVASNDVGDGPGGVSPSVVVQSQVPGPPTAVTAVAANGAVTLDWAPAAGNGTTVTGYIVRDQAGATHPFSGAPPITLTGLNNGTAYAFTVSAIGANATVGPPAATTPATVTPAGVPTATTNVVATPQSTTTLRVAFDAPATSNGTVLTGWVVTTTPATSTVTVTGSPATLSGLVSGTTYTVTVTPVPATGPSGPGMTTPPVAMPVVPGPVTGLTIVDTGTYDPAVGAWVMISWFPVPGATSYEINPGDGTPVFTVPSPSDPAATTVNGGWVPVYLPYGVFTVTVLAVNAWGAGASAAATYMLPPPWVDPCPPPQQMCVTP